MTRSTGFENAVQLIPRTLCCWQFRLFSKKR